jgi:hypothetical protein
MVKPNGRLVKLRGGNLSVAFPEGSFPPPLPFVGDTLPFAPT